MDGKKNENKKEVKPVSIAISSIKSLKNGIMLGKKLSVRKLIKKGRK